MNPFYRQSIIVQWAIAIFMFILMFVVMGFWLESMDKLILGYLLIFLVVPIFQFLATPFFTLIGLYTYLSPMLLVFGANKKKYDLHNGTSFDYFMLMRHTKAGLPFRQKMLQYYLEGLIKIIEKIEAKELPVSIIVRGSSYFFSDRTAKRLGFNILETGFIEKINLIFNYLDLVWMYSISHGKFVWPNLKNIKTAETSGEELLAHKAKLMELLTFLQRSRP